MLIWKPGARVLTFFPWGNSLSHLQINSMTSYDHMSGKYVWPDGRTYHGGWKAGLPGSLLWFHIHGIEVQGPSMSQLFIKCHFISLRSWLLYSKKHYIIITVYKLYIINWSHLHFVVVLDGLIGGLSVSPNRASRKVREQDRLSIPMPRAKVARAFGKTTRPTGCGSQGLDARWGDDVNHKKNMPEHLGKTILFYFGQ